MTPETFVYATTRVATGFGRDLKAAAQDMQVKLATRWRLAVKMHEHVERKRAAAEETSRPTTHS